MSKLSPDYECNGYPCISRVAAKFQLVMTGLIICVSLFSRSAAQQTTPATGSLRNESPPPSLIPLEF